MKFYDFKKRILRTMAMVGATGVVFMMSNIASEEIGEKARRTASSISDEERQIRADEALRQQEELERLFAGDVDVQSPFASLDTVSLVDVNSEEYRRNHTTLLEGEEIVDYACNFLGNPYVWGGSSLTNGTDCSGFIMSVYGKYGYSLPHSSSAIRSLGERVDSLAEAQAGDIICYDGHVALYMGDNKIVHAATEDLGIIVSSPSYREIVSIRRILV